MGDDYRSNDHGSTICRSRILLAILSAGLLFRPAMSLAEISMDGGATRVTSHARSVTTFVTATPSTSS
jgi:hypothetical protein